MLKELRLNNIHQSSKLGRREQEQSMDRTDGTVPQEIESRQSVHHGPCHGDSDAILFEPMKNQ